MVSNIPFPFAMDRHEDNNSTYEQPEAVSPQRPPQFSRRNCVCRRCSCGCGDGGESRGEKGGESDSETVVNSSDEENPVHSGSASPIAGSYIVQIEPNTVDREQSSNGSQPSYGSHDTPRSMGPEPNGTEDHFAVSRDERAHIISPGPDFERLGEEEAKLVYYFLIEPLRLSPQHQDCRGEMPPYLVF